MLAAGKLDQRITIRRATESKGADYADVQRTWATLAERWAEVAPLSGRETFRNREQGSTASVLVRCRYDSTLAGVTAKDQVLHGSRVLEIVEPPRNVQSADVMVEFLCADFVNG
jgi:head-tail adaptor